MTIQKANTNALSFEQLQAAISGKSDTATEQLLNQLNTDNNKSSNIDIEKAAFGSTTLGKTNPTKIYRAQTINWHNPNDEDKQQAIDTMVILGIKGFVLKAKDGYALYASDEMKAEDENAPATICYSTQCTVGEYTYTGRGSSPFPLSRWQTYGKGSNSPTSHIKTLRLMGSRGQSCAECILNRNNIEGTKQGRENNCKVTAGILFGVTHVAKKNNKKAEGIEWVRITEVLDDDQNPYYTRPVIINIESTPSVNGSGGDSRIYVEGLGAVGLATAGNGGDRFIPDDVKLFYPYWQELMSQNLIKPAARNSNFPEHPRLPLNILAQTEMFLAKPAASCSYASSCPAFRTSDTLANPEVFKDWLEVMQTYIDVYEDYKTSNNITDNSYTLASNNNTLTATSTPVLNGHSNGESTFDATQANVYVYKGE